jgi:integrase
MGSLYTKRGKLWVRFKNERGKWAGAPTAYSPGQEDLALRYLKQRERRIAAVVEAGADLGATPGEPLTVAQYATKWIRAREPLGLATASDDETRLRKHVLPKLGEVKLEEVRPRHIRDLIMELRAAGTLAPRTIHHVFHTTKAMFHHALADELIDSTPCVLPRGTLPKKVDKDPEWRAGAIYTREEVERLISDTRIPEDRRILYALKALAGLRHGEAAGLTWRQYDATLEPLGGLSLERTKTQVPRRVPVHPTLARVLAEWKLSGWERTYGRAPTSADLVAPSRNLTPKDKHEAPKQLAADLELLKLRPRRGHDLRRTFVTLAQVDGARRDLLETISHGPRGDIVSVYTTFPWPALCAEVEKLRISLREGLVLDGDFRTLATRFATTHRKGRNRWQKLVTPPGIEPGIAP